MDCNEVVNKKEKLPILRK